MCRTDTHWLKRKDIILVQFTKADAHDMYTGNNDFSQYCV